jgi:hypothetical protein
MQIKTTFGFYFTPQEKKKRRNVDEDVRKGFLLCCWGDVN